MINEFDDKNNAEEDENRENDVDKDNSEDKKREDDDKLNKKQENKNELEELAKEVDKLIDEVSSEYGIDPEKLKVMPIQLPKMTFKAVLITSLVIFVLDFLVMLALNGFFNWCEWGSHSDLVFFALYFAGVDMVLKLASLPLFPKNPKNIIYVSVLKIVPFIFTMVICGIWPIFIKIISYWFYVFIGLIIYAIRKFLITYYLEKQLTRMMTKISTEKNSKRIRK